MMKSLKKYVLSAFLVAGTIICLQSQIVVMQYRSVPQENVAEFIFRETTYWSQVASKAIREGKMIKWELWQRIGGYQLDNDEHNFVFFNVFEDKYDLDENIWNIQEVFPHLRITDMSTTTLGRTIHQLVLEEQANAGLTEGAYCKINYAKVFDMDAFLKFESEEWKPFVNKAIRNGETSFIGWQLSTVVTPTGSQIPFDAVTVDFFDKYSEAVQPRWSEGVQLEGIDASIPTRDRILAQIYGLVISVP